MKTALFTLALSLIALPAIANPANYIQLVRSQDNNTIAAISDRDLLEYGITQCLTMGDIPVDEYLPWLRDHARSEGLSEGSVEVLTIIAISANFQLCDEQGVQELMRQQ